MLTQFPTKATGHLQVGESPSKFDVKDEVNDIAADTEGGYEYRRERNTRPGRTTIKTGFISLTHADYLILRQFWFDHKRTVSFGYFDYIHGVTRQVRFEKEPDWKPEIIGTRRMWSPSFEMKEI